jgi:GDP-L-fucose synthase
LLRAYSGEQHINIGTSQDVTIQELAELVCEVVGFAGGIATDTTKPDGTPRKLMSSERLKELGWEPRVPLRDGIEQTYRWFLENRT